MKNIADIFKNKTAGQEAYPSSVAFGALYIQRWLGLTDRELIDQISEIPLHVVLYRLQGIPG